MSVLLLTENFPPKTGGSGRWFWELYRRLPRQEVIIAAGDQPNACEFDRMHDLRVTRMNLSLRSWGLFGISEIRNYWRPWKSLRKLVRAERPQMIHCGRCLPEGLMGLATKLWTGVPYLCYVHGEELKYTNDSRELKWLTRRVIGSAQFLIANSHNTARILKQEWSVPDERIRVVHPGVDTQLFRPAERSQVVRDRLGWRERPVILSVGRLQKRKGHDVMIAALAEIRRSVKDVLFAIVGDGEERPLLEEMIQRADLHDHVVFHGELSDDAIIECYQQCDIFALPNRQVGQDIEGFGIVLLEAQACGKPVVAGASGGTAETMKVPETGRLVACEEPPPLADAIIDLLSDRSRLAMMGDAGRIWVVEKFDWVHLAEQARQLFHIDSALPVTPAASSERAEDLVAGSSIG